MPRLSVLLPVKDAASTVGIAISSTLRALPGDSELVVMDDGSTDGTSEILTSLANRHPQMSLHSNRMGGGVASSLNELLNRSDSEYVARMDADDICLPWRFNAQDRLLKGGAAIAFSVVAVYDEKKSSLKPQLPFAIPSHWAPNHLLLGNPFVHSTMYGRRVALNDVGGYRSVPSEDYDLWLRLALAGYRLERGKVPTLVYRRHWQQITANHSWRKAAARNELTARSHAELSERLLGKSFDVFSAIRRESDASALDPRERCAVSAFLSEVEEVMKDAPGIQRRVLRRQVRTLRGRV
jgi:glycosyltransferase involved in cell wall biosynthesis